MRTEEYLAELATGCPLCGTNEERQSRRELRVRDLQSRATRLQQRLEELEQSPELVVRLRAHLGQMCGTCQLLMTGMSAPADAAELSERIRRQIADFDEELSRPHAAA
jgi:hypothetical protein